MESEVKWVKSATKEGGKERLYGKRSQVGEISEQRKVAKKGCMESEVKWVKSATKEGGKERLYGKRSQVGEISDQGRWQRKVVWKAKSSG